MAKREKKESRSSTRSTKKIIPKVQHGRDMAKTIKNKDQTKRSISHEYFAKALGAEEIKLKPIPKFKTEAEEREFRETHDTAKYFDLSKAKRVAFPNLKPVESSYYESPAEIDFTGTILGKFDRHGKATSTPWLLQSFRFLKEYRIQVRFEDGTEGAVDLKSDIMGKNAGVFKALRDSAVFHKAKLVDGVLTWPGGLDMAPDAMYDDIIKQEERVNSQFECGAGWRPIINDLIAGIDKEVKKASLTNFKILQIKEKFGDLRVYVDGGSAAIDALIGKASKKAAVTCENCGKPGKKRLISEIVHPWYKTLCPKCFAKSQTSKARGRLDK